MLDTLEIPATTGVLLVAVAVCWFATGSARKEKNKKAPPAVPRLPIVGSVPFLNDLSNLHLSLTQKSKTYGNIFSMHTGSRDLVVLNGHEAIREALQKKSTDFSGRGEIYVDKHVWTDRGKGVLARPTSDDQRKDRSNCLSVLKNFGFGNSAVMEQRIQDEVSFLVQYVSQMDGGACYPGPVLDHSSMNVIYNLLFGQRFPHDDATGQELRRLGHNLTGYGAIILDILPIASRLPSFRRELSDSARDYDKYLRFCEDKVKESAGSDDDNFVKEYIRINGSEAVNMRELAVIIRDLTIAGTESASCSLNWALILLANHPQVQARLQQDIDSVVPRDRRPSLDDKPRLSYLEAVILETFRLKPAFPLGLPRVTVVDTEVAGYEIPAGTEVVANLWSAHMDPQVFSEPEKFIPERFLDSNGAITNRDLMIAFSFGKRSCLGEILARQEMFLFLSALVQQFNILPPEGEAKVKDDMHFNRILRATEHSMRFVPRY